MMPVIQIGSLTLSTYTIMFNVGIISMFVLMFCQRKVFSISVTKALLFTLFMTVSGILGTKILYCIEFFDEVIKNGLSSLGSPLFGAVFFVPVFMIPLCKLISLPKEKTLDACALCLPIMVGFLRFGCFFAGCCGGTTAVWNNISFTWPTQAMDSISNFLILWYLLSLQKEGKFLGKFYPLYMMLYSVMRFAIEFLRDTEKDWFGLGHGQCFAIIAFVIGLFWFFNKGLKAYEKKTQ